MIITDVKTAVEAAKAKNLSSHIPEDFCISHPKTKAVGSFVYRECGFTEYDPCCNICIGTYVNSKKKFLTKLLKDPSSGGTMHCEACDTVQDKYLRTEEGVEENLRIYKDPEDGSWTYMCTGCYEAQKAKDEKYYEEELRYQQEQDMSYDPNYRTNRWYY